MTKLEKLLKAMGLEMEYEDIPEDKLKVANIRDPKDLMKSARIPFEVSNDLYKDVKTISPQDTRFPEEWQRKGLGKELYKDLERITEGKIVPGNDQTDKSFGLHDKYGFGKEFGLKDETLNKLASPKERLERDVRKESLKRGLDSLASEFDIAETPKYNPDLGDIQADYDKQILRATKYTPEVDPRNIGTLFDNLVAQARNLPTGKEAASFVRDNIPKTLSKVKSLVPGLLTGGAGLALSGASEASDAPEAGDSVGQAALLRNRDAMKQEKQIESSTSVPDHVKLEALKRFKQNKLPY